MLMGPEGDFSEKKSRWQLLTPIPVSWWLGGAGDRSNSRLS
jgi:hypothetical protein